MTPDMDGMFLLTRVVDGDTVNGSIHLPDILFDGWWLSRWREDSFRIITVDTPERKQTGWAEAKADVVYWLRDPVRSKSLRVRTYGRDSLGRTLGDIYDRETGGSLSEYLLRERGWLPWVAS